MDAIESVQVTLRGTMDKLSSEDFKDFKFHLKTKNEIPWKKLEKADRDETIDLMVQAYMEASGQEVINLLRKMKQNMMANELEKELKLQQASSQPFTGEKLHYDWVTINGCISSLDFSLAGFPSS